MIIYDCDARMERFATQFGITVFVNVSSHIFIAFKWFLDRAWVLCAMWVVSRCLQDVCTSEGHLVHAHERICVLAERVAIFTSPSRRQSWQVSSSKFTSVLCASWALQGESLDVQTYLGRLGHTAIICHTRDAAWLCQLQTWQYESIWAVFALFALPQVHMAGLSYMH